MTQKEMLLPPVSRNTDPHSSHIAESEVNKNGSRQHNIEIVYEAIRDYPMHTTKELAQKCGLDRHETARRASDLYTQGRVKRIEEGTDELRWFVFNQQYGGIALIDAVENEAHTGVLSHSDGRGCSQGLEGEKSQNIHADANENTDYIDKPYIYHEPKAVCISCPIYYRLAEKGRKCKIEGCK